MKKFLFAVFAVFTIFAFAEEKSEKADLPNGYEGLTLKMSLDSAKDALKSNGIFGYRGERDVSLLPTQNRTLIEVNGSDYLGRCWFQFHEDALYSITINFREKKIDFYSIWTTLQKKYGEPNSVSPQKITWENDAVLMTLERPLSVKYVDKEIFQKINENSKTQKSAEEIMRQQILEGL